MSVEVDVPQNADAEVTNEQAPANPYEGLADEIAKIEADAKAEAAGEKPAAADDDAPPVAKAVPPKADDLDAALEAKLNERAARQEEIQASKRAAKEASDKILGETEKKAADIVAAAEKKAQEILDRLRKDPLSAIRDAGWDPKGLMMNLAEDGTPQATMQRQLMEANARAARVESEFRAYVEGQQRSQAEQQRLAQEAHHREQANKFVAFATTDQRPSLAAMFGGEDRPAELRKLLVDQADAEVDRYKSEHGVYPTWDQVADTLEQRYSKGKSAAQPKAEAPKNSGKPPSRAVSQAAASEKRTSQKSWDEMSDREQRQLMIQEAEAAAKAAEANER